MMGSRAQNSMLLILSLYPAPSQIFLCQRWLKEALSDVSFKSHVTRRADGPVISLRSFRPMEEVRLATALRPATSTSILGNSVRDR
jgi:hypothetical protein